MTILTPVQVQEIENAWPTDKDGEHPKLWWKYNAGCAIASHRTVVEDGKENAEMVVWYGALVKRACIGTPQTPSLRAYIEQLEAEVTRLRGILNKIACGNEPWEREGMIDLALQALTGQAGE